MASLPSQSRFCCTRCAVSARLSSTRPRATARKARPLTCRCDSMRNWPARLMASAACAASISPRETSPTRRLACIDAVRSRLKASSSLSCWARISTPLALSTHLRSSSRATAPANARAWVWPCWKRATASAWATASVAASTSAGRQAIRCRSSRAAKPPSGMAVPTSSTGQGALAASSASASRSVSSSTGASTATACGASRTTARTKLWQGSGPLEAWPPACRRRRRAWAWAMGAGLSWQVISRGTVGASGEAGWRQPAAGAV